MASCPIVGVAIGRQFGLPLEAEVELVYASPANDSFPFGWPLDLSAYAVAKAIGVTPIAISEFAGSLADEMLEGGIQDMVPALQARTRVELELARGPKPLPLPATS